MLKCTYIEVAEIEKPCSRMFSWHPTLFVKSGYSDIVEHSNSQDKANIDKERFLYGQFKTFV